MPEVLGPQAERLLQREITDFTTLLERFEDGDWNATTRVGDAPVARLVQHLAEGGDRLATAIERRYEDAEPGPLLQPFDDPSTPPTVEHESADPGVVLSRYREHTGRLLRVLSLTRQADWSWPVWSPLGGLETLAEATRRWLAHHFVHRDDVTSACARRLSQPEETVRLVVEFVLDAIARRGGDAVEPPIAFEVITSLPGAGSWTLIFDRDAAPQRVGTVWDEIIGSVQDHPDHRVERGPADYARVQVTGAGDVVWRAAFGRGATWDQLSVHSDDAGKGLWAALVGAMEPARAGEVGRLQH